MAKNMRREVHIRTLAPLGLANELVWSSACGSFVKLTLHGPEIELATDSERHSRFHQLSKQVHVCTVKVY